ncbi:MAG TPA: RES family NAD+ phosphorylase [Anaeromyxobacteraceae bacterium]|nr:RES family NAD+ phosphorylase [Anaeromyxobacteraceae bacterium]
MRVYRLANLRDPTNAFSGEGARRVAGRWHPAGLAIVYTSSSQALALLEVLVHAELSQLKTIGYAFAVDIPDELIETPDLKSLPAGWNHPRRSDHARAFGLEWAASKRSLALAVPSVIVPQERNVLINPAHPDFRALAIGNAVPLPFDERLIKAVSAPGARGPRRRRGR